MSYDGRYSAEPRGGEPQGGTSRIISSSKCLGGSGSCVELTHGWTGAEYWEIYYLEPFTEYTVSWWAKRDGGGSEEAQANSRVWCTGDPDNDGDEGTDRCPENRLYSYTVSGQWQYHSYNFTTGADTKNFTKWVGLLDTYDSMYVDDVSLVQVGQSSCNIVDSSCGEWGRGYYNGACTEGQWAGWRVAGGQWVTCSNNSGCDVVNSGCGEWGRGDYGGQCLEGQWDGWQVSGGSWQTCSNNSGCNVVNSGCGEWGRGDYGGSCLEGQWAGWQVSGGQWVTCSSSSSCAVVNSGCGEWGRGYYEGSCIDGQWDGWRVSGGNWEGC